jgi:hypothetical protein
VEGFGDGQQGQAQPSLTGIGRVSGLNKSAGQAQIPVWLHTKAFMRVAVSSQALALPQSACESRHQSIAALRSVFTQDRASLGARLFASQWFEVAALSVRIGARRSGAVTRRIPVS